MTNDALPAAGTLSQIPPSQESPADVSLKSIKVRLLTSGVWAFVGQVGSMLAGMFSTVLLARILSPEDLGVYFLALSIVMAASQFALLGLQQTVVRFIAEFLATGKPGRARKSLEYAFALATVGATITAVLVYLAGGWLGWTVFQSPILTGAMGLVALWIFPSAFKSLIAESFRGFQDIRLASIFGDFSFKAVSSILFLWVWITKGHTSLTTLLVLVILATTFPAIVGGVLLFRKVRTLGAPAPVSRRAMLDMALPMFVMSVALYGLKQTNLWVTGAFLPEGQIAIWGAANRLIMLLSMPIAVVNLVLPPFILVLKERNLSSLEHTLRFVATYASIPSFIITLVLMAKADSIMALVYGEFYGQGGTVLALLSAGQLVSVLTGSCGLTLKMTGHHNAITAITVVSGILNVIMSVLFVKPLGLVGIAFAYTIAVSLQNVVALVFSRKLLGIWTCFSFSFLNKSVVSRYFKVER